MAWITSAHINFDFYPLFNRSHHMAGKSTMKGVLHVVCYLPERGPSSVILVYWTRKFTNKETTPVGGMVLYIKHMQKSPRTILRLKLAAWFNSFDPEAFLYERVKRSGFQSSTYDFVAPMFLLDSTMPFIFWCRVWLTSRERKTNRDLLGSMVDSSLCS